MTRTADAVIIGAGIIGLSAAYYLKKKGCERIVVMEKEPSWVTGSSAKANGGFRQQFSTPANIKLSRLSLAVFENFEEEFQTDISFRQYGYLFVTATQEGERTLRSNGAMQRSLGVPVDWLGPGDVLSIAPFLRKDDLRGGNFCPKDGYADSYSIAVGFGRAARSLGALIETDSPVIEILSDSKGVTGVRSPKQILETRVVVNATGPNAAEIGKLAGIEIPVNPVRRMLLLTEDFPVIPETIPMIIDGDTGFFLRKESGRVLMGWSDPSEPIGYNLSFDPAHIDQVAQFAMSRIPALEDAQVNPRKSWAGLYEVTPDHHCILGQSRELPGFFLANGFSGHGMMHSPAAGKIIADLVLEGKTDLMDVSTLRLERFREGDLIHENLII